MRVGLVVDGDLEQATGGYRYDRKLVEFLESRGDTVDVISLSEASEESVGDRTGAAPSSELQTRLDRPYDVLLQDELCYARLLEYNPRLERPGSLVSLVHLLRAPDPTVYDPRAREREWRYLESVDAAICTSEYTRDRTLALAGTDLPTQVAHPAGRHDGPALTPDTVETRAHRDPFRVVSVGTLEARKNVTTLLEALARLDSSSTEWSLTVVGREDDDPAYASVARERAAELGIDDRVTFTGEVETAALESILEGAHVLAVPSRYEGFGMAYLEAMEYGVVPIAGTVGGAREIVSDGENGFLIDPTDSRRLADRLERLATDRDRLATLGVEALQTARDHPSWTDTLEPVREFLRRSIHRSGRTDGEQP
ncbi:Glycosyltransferase involved in cell wall bisynthesis [Natronorubrum sediminis]|uniref:Glycosyltransferase involved in cell wall bisynthesis n=1 Tax=Natronorubrum sediminis TaxID=640943 RepID=A0A1H6FKC0_9EURY|nr:glycosyltransferase family 4 protein [Natronorubrum sediminis]SEH11311.1 Glycosyltransferase involved in cell wall bisynthesis [Natronorubrum sediminis]